MKTASDFFNWLYVAGVSRRNIEICKMRFNEVTYKEIGLKHGISTNRARQIFVNLQRRHKDFQARNERAARLMLEENAQRSTSKTARLKKSAEAKFQFPLEDTDLHEGLVKRLHNWFALARPFYFSILVGKTDDEILSAPGVGRKGLRSIREMEHRVVYLYGEQNETKT